MLKAKVQINESIRMHMQNYIPFRRKTFIYFLIYKLEAVELVLSLLATVWY